MRRAGRVGFILHALSLLLLLLVYVGAAAYQLGLPGLHYDEAKEAGINALELLHGAPVTAFRGAMMAVGPWSLPLMVQDYIGALNVYLVMPFLALTGVGVPNLRWPAVLIGALTLLLLERTVSEWWTWQTGTHAPVDREPNTAPAPPVTLAGLLSVAFLALSASFVFWSRQGIFVTNLIQPLCLLAIWQGLRWLRWGQARAFVLTGFSAGLALYGKLLAGWVLAPFALLALFAYLRWRGQRENGQQPRLSPLLLGGGLLAFGVGLSPLILFNIQTGGTLVQVGDNLAQSYYGVDNRAWAENLIVRVGQAAATLRGDHFWYLGGLYGNAVAPWLALLSAAAVVRRPQLVGGPLLLALSAVGLSIFTISDLFITHYALLQPFLVAAAGIGLAAWFQSDAQPGHEARPRAWSRFLESRRSLAHLALALVVALWVGLDAAATLRYHAALARSGGLSDHSDATYHFAYYLRHTGPHYDGGAPVALDWGLEAPVRYLSDNSVQPIEIFGYASPAAPDAEFGARLAHFLDNPANVYLLRSPVQTVFVGRREVFLSEAQAQDRTPVLLETFAQRDGAPLFEVWRVE